MTCAHNQKVRPKTSQDMERRFYTDFYESETTCDNISNILGVIELWKEFSAATTIGEFHSFHCCNSAEFFVKINLVISELERGCPYMTSDDFCPFLTPPPHLIRCFVSEPYFIKSDLAEPLSPLASDVIYGRPLSKKNHL